MELIDTILVAMMAGMTKALIDILWAILQSLMYLIVNVSIIDESNYIKQLDVYLAKNGICLIRNFDHTRVPESGYHFAISRKWIFPTGFLVAYKTSGSRTVYWAGRGMHDLRRKIIGDPNLVCERTITMLSASNPSIQFRRIKPPDTLTKWQAKLVDLIIDEYNKTNRGSWFICGPPGCGKSTIGSLVAKRLIGPGIDPVLATGGDFMTPGLSIGYMFYTPYKTSPTILLLNEFDCAIRHAERDTTKDSTGARETVCIANTPTVMLNSLDYIMNTPHLIVIATTNVKQSELVTGIYQRYTRAGRFDNHYQVRDDDGVVGPTKSSLPKSDRGRAKKSRTK